MRSQRKLGAKTPDTRPSVLLAVQISPPPISGQRTLTSCGKMLAPMPTHSDLPVIGLATTGDNREQLHTSAETCVWNREQRLGHNATTRVVGRTRFSYLVKVTPLLGDLNFPSKLVLSSRIGYSNPALRTGRARFFFK